VLTVNLGAMPEKSVEIEVVFGGRERASDAIGFVLSFFSSINVSK